jgi:hypothetical protein
MNDYYRHYSKIYDGTKNEVDRKLHSKILDGILLGIANAMSEKMYDFKLPYNLGRIITRKYRPTAHVDEDGKITMKRPIDWKETKKLWKEYPYLEKVQYVYHTNPHSGGYIFAILYRKRGCLFKNRLFYTAQVNRSIKRSIAKRIMDSEFDTLETK